MKKPPEVIIIRETVAESWMSDASSWALFVFLIGMGVFLDSSAMQWFGALIGFLVVLSRVKDVRFKNAMTIEQARVRLDEIAAEIDAARKGE